LLTCKQFLAELSDFLDESLGVAERKQLEDHINACPNCWVISIPTEVRSRLMKALEKKMAAKRGSTL
jgi:hypothetical protein